MKKTMKKVTMKKWCAAVVALTMVSASAVQVMADDTDSTVELVNDIDIVSALELGAAPSSGGWFSTAEAGSSGTSGNLITLSGEVESSNLQSMPTTAGGKIWLNTSTPGIQMYKQWSQDTSTIGFNADGKYHISWKQYMPNSTSYNGAWGRGSYLALVRGYGTKLLETVRIGFDDECIEEGNASNSAYYPAIYYCDSNSLTPNAAGSISTIKDYTTWSTNAVKKGTFYVCDAYIVTSVSGEDTIEFKCWPYGESEENAVSVTKTFENINTFRAVRFFNFASQSDSDKQGIADLKIEKIYDASSNYDTLRDAISEFNPDFSNITSQSDLREAASYEPADDIKLKWISNDTDKIDTTDGTPVLKTTESGQLCLTARLSIGTKYIDKSFPVTLKGNSSESDEQISKVLLSDDFSGMEGTGLASVEAETDKGWASGYTQVSGSLDASNIVETAYGNAISVKAVKPSETENPVVEISRKLVEGIDFDVDRTYYITWNQLMDDYGYSNGYKNQRLQLRGNTLSIGGTNNVEISPQFTTMTALTDTSVMNNSFDGDYFPARLYVKYGNKNNYQSVKNFVAQKGRMYTFAVRIDASSVGNDTIYIKAYPTGTPAVTSWQLDTTAESKATAITGVADTIGFFANPVTEDASIIYGDLKIDSVSKSGTSRFEEAENLINNGSKSAADAAIAELPDGAWKSELEREAATKDDFVVGAVSFIQETETLLPTGDKDESGNDVCITKACKVMTTKLIGESDVTAKITLANNSSQNKECVVVAALYNDEGQMLRISKGETELISAYGTKDCSVNVEYVEGAKTVKLFILSNLKEIKPLNTTIKLDDAGLTQ